MHRARRIIGWFLAAVVALFGAALLAVNLYVQSQGTQGRIQQELSQRLDMTLRIQRISVTPWGGLKLSGITIPQTNPGATPAFLEASSFRLLVRFDSIFRGPLVIKEVALVKPQVTWAQNESGKWRLPSRAVEQVPAPPAKSTSPHVETGPARSRESPMPSARRCKICPFLNRRSSGSGCSTATFIFSIDKMGTWRSSMGWNSHLSCDSRIRCWGALALARFRCGIAFFCLICVQLSSMTVTRWNSPR